MARAVEYVTPTYPDQSQNGPGSATSRTHSASLPLFVARRRLVVVLGMHRGGTSLITRALKVLGVELGDRVLPADEGINDSGYWEDRDLTQLNEDMLQALGTDWHHLMPLPADFVERLRAKGFLLAAVELLRRKSSPAPVFGFKDPRVSLLLPFWKVVFAQCDLDVSYVIAIRNPISVIRSLERRDRFELEKSALLWLIHTVSLMEEAMHEASVAVIDYDRLMCDPDTELQRIAAIMSLDVDPGELHSYRTDFLRPDLRHTQYKPEDLTLNAFTSSLVHELYVSLLAVARGEVPLNSASIQAQVATCRKNLASWTYPLCLMDSLYHFKRDGVLQIEQGQRDVDARQREVEAARDEAEARQREVQAARDETEARRREVAAARDEAEARQREIEAARHEIETGQREIEARQRALEVSCAEVQRLKHELATLESALAARETEIAHQKAIAATAKSLQAEIDAQRDALWAARSSELEGKNQQSTAAIAAEMQRSLERGVELGVLRGEAAEMTGRLGKMTVDLAEMRQASIRDQQVMADQHTSLRVFCWGLSLSADESRMLKERCEWLEDARRRAETTATEREAQLAESRREVAEGAERIERMEQEAENARLDRIRGAEAALELEANARRMEQALAANASTIKKLDRDLDERASEVAQAKHTIAGQEQMVAAQRATLEEQQRQRTVISHRLAASQRQVEFLQRRLGSSEQMILTLEDKARCAALETAEIRGKLEDSRAESRKLERENAALGATLQELEFAKIRSEGENARLKRMLASRKSEAVALQAALTESERRMESLSASIDDLRSHISQSEMPPPDPLIAGDPQRCPSALELLLARDGLEFVREAYRALLLREPDAEGRDFYWARLRSGIPKLQILRELKNSPEGRDADCQLDGLQTALRWQGAARLPVLGRLIGKILNVESSGLVENNLRALKQQFMDASQSTAARAAQIERELRLVQGRAAIPRIPARATISRVDDPGEIRAGGPISAVQPDAPPLLRPIVFQFEYAQTASPTSVGLSTDSRELAAGYRCIRMIEATTGTTVCDIDFTANGNARDFVLFGFSDNEEWGTWSLGKKSAIVVWLAPQELDDIEVFIDAQPFEPAFTDVHCVLTSSRRHRAEFVIDSSRVTCRAAIAKAQDNPGEILLFGGTLDSACRNNISLSEGTPKCSIIILNFNKPQLSLLSARSVLSAKISYPYEVIIVDNGSSLDNYAVLTSTDVPVRIHRIPCNRYFGEGNNLGAEAARGEYLVFLNNDAFLVPDSLNVLLKAFERDPNCGIAGPVFRYPDGRLQEAGAFIDADGMAEQRGKFGAALDVAALPEFGHVDYVSAACLMIRTELFHDLGGFNYRFDPAYYEDTDLCFRVRLRDQRVVLARDAACFHIENATTADKRSVGGAISTVEHNRKVFLSIWGKFLKGRSTKDLPSELIPIDGPASRGLRRIAGRRETVTQATYSPYPLVPGGGERYILAATRALNRLGPATLVTPDPYSSLRLDNVMFDLGLPVGDVRTGSLHDAERQAFERAIVMGNEVYPPLCLTSERNFFHCQFPFPLNEAGARNLKAGLNLLAQYEKVIVNSEFTRQAYEVQLRKLGRSAQVEVVNPPVATQRLLSLRGERKPWILSVGRFSAAGHSKRQDVLIEALRATPRNFREEWKLILCGSVPHNAADRLYFKELQESVGNDIHVEFVLSPPTSLVDSLYAQASIYAHACGFGVREPEEYWKCEHFGITLVEALVAGCQVIGYEVGGGPEIVRAVGAGAVYGSIDELASQLPVLGARRADERARIRAAKLFGDEAFYDRLTAVVA